MAKKQELDEDILAIQEDEDETVELEEKKSKGKKLPIVPIAIGGVVLLIIVFIVSKLLSGGKANAYDVTNTILSNQLGTFSYTIDVKTKPVGTETEKKESSSEVDELNNMESVGEMENTETPEETTTEEQKPQTEWGNSDGTETGYWKYPNYKITIAGCTMSTEPLETQFTVSIATEYFNDTFTEVIVKDGNYYFDIEQMRYWLVSSKDSYLVTLGEKIPEGNKYLVIPESEFYVYSRYAEDSELELSKTTSLLTGYNNSTALLTSLINTVRLDNCVTSEKDTSSVVITGEDSIKLANNIKGIVQSWGSVYESYINSAYANTTEGSKDLTQARREKDNTIQALNDLFVYLNITDLSTLNLQVQGASRQFANGKGNDTLEADWNIKYQAHETDYNISISLSRSGNTAEIVAPTSSTTTVDSLSDSYLIFNTINECVDYFNFTDIATSKQLEITPTSIKNNILEMFIKLVNDAGTYDQYLTLDNVDEYLELYANYEETDDTTNNDLINAQLVTDFFNSVNSVTGGVVVEVEKEDTQEINRYTTISDTVTFDGKDVNFTAVYNEAESTEKLIVLDLAMKYNVEVSEEAVEDSDEVVDDSITVDLTNFSLHTLLQSNYPANNETILRNFDNNFDFNTMQTEIKIQPNIPVETKLYIVISSDGGYMDLWYGDTNFGEIINY